MTLTLPSLGEIKALFTKREPAGLTRGYRDLVSAGGGVNADWGINSLSEDSDVWQNAYLLTSRVRSLARENPTFQKYRDLIWANTFGSNGIMLRMRIKEAEDRVVYAADEKAALVAHERRIQRIRDFAAARGGREPEQYRAFKLADMLDRRDLDAVIRAKATVSVGAPDLFANQLFERGYRDWQRAENCDARGTRCYNVIRQLRLWSAIRDGGFFIRMVVDKRANRYGFTLQLINDEWCDRFYNTVLPNGNVVRQGIEYESTEWGIGKRIAFYFIRRQPQDWQFSIPTAFSFSSGTLHQRVPASEIIHYIRCVDAEGTRPAPWVASVIPTARHLDQYQLYEVIAAREEACKTGFYYSDVVPEGGMAAALPDPRTGGPTEQLAPGERRGLAWGVKYQQNDPTHPSANFEAFRKGMLRNQAAGMPGADYNTLANDLENINFSAGRLGRLDTNEMSMMIQQNDIDTAECPIFERWQESALIFGAIPLPLAKLSKFNQKEFQGRRWRQVDEVKEETASAMRIANKRNSRTREGAELGLDFEEIALELAEEEILLAQYGLSTTTTAEQNATLQNGDDKEEEDDEPAAKPKPKNGKKTKAVNGHRFALTDGKT